MVTHSARPWPVSYSRSAMRPQRWRESYHSTFRAPLLRLVASRSAPPAPTSCCRARCVTKWIRACPSTHHWLTSAMRPADLSKGNHHLFYEPVNRGSWLSLGLFNSAAGRDALDKASAAGNGFLMRQGYTLVYGGWQPPYPGPAVPGMGVASGSRLTPGDGKLTARLPIARFADG